MQVPGAPDAPLDRLVRALRAATRRRCEDFPDADLAGLRQAVERLPDGFDGLTDDVVGPRLQQTCRMFDLTDLDARLLVAAASAAVDPTLGLALGRLDGLRSIEWPTVAVVLEVVGEAPWSAPARARLLEPAPLIEAGLLAVADPDRPFPARRVVPADRVVDHLLGVDRTDPVVSAMLVPAIATPGDPAAEVAAAIRAGARFVHLHTPPGADGVGTALAAVEVLGAAAVVVDLTRRPRRCAARDAFTAAVREAALRGCALVVTGLAALVEEGPAAADAVFRAAVPVVGVGGRSWQAGWASALPFEVDARPAAPADRRRWWADALAARTADGSGPGEVDETAGVVPVVAWPVAAIDVARVVEVAATAAAAAGVPVDGTHLRRAAARLTDDPDHPGVHRERPDATFDDLVLLPTTADLLKELSGWVSHRDEVRAQGWLPARMDRSPGIAALFTGAPGTGKTLAARALAGSLGLDLLTADLSAVVDKYVGETEKNLDRVFAAAESANAVLFFDEADALFGARSGVNDAKDRFANQEVAYLLQRLETFRGVLVLASNLRGNVDPAFSRRLHFVVDFPSPDAAARIALWRAHLPAADHLDPEDPIEVEPLGRTLELTGGEIRNIARAAVYRAAAGRERLGWRHVRVAVTREYTKLARIVPDAFSSRRLP